MTIDSSSSIRAVRALFIYIRGTLWPERPCKTKREINCRKKTRRRLCTFCFSFHIFYCAPHFAVCQYVQCCIHSLCSSSVSSHFHRCVFFLLLSFVCVHNIHSVHYICFDSIDFNSVSLLFFACLFSCCRYFVVSDAMRVHLYRLRTTVKWKRSEFSHGLYMRIIIIIEIEEKKKKLCK